MTMAGEQRPVLVVGAGPAGVAAACALAECGERPLWIDQNQAAGGVFHRQPLVGIASLGKPRAARLQWQRLTESMVYHALFPQTGCVFLGIEGDGNALIEDRQRGVISVVRPRAVIAATGAVERIRPLEGWTLPGVVTAGGLQLMIKQTGALPPGRILLAGNGPLLIALASQMVALRRLPVAVLEQGRPWGGAAEMLALAARPGLIAEAAGHAARLAVARVPWQFGVTLRSIVRTHDGLEAEVEQDGRRAVIGADVIALHDGIRSNDFGLPIEDSGGVPVLRAGDCRETLGWLAAEHDGRRAAAQALARCTDASIPENRSGGILARERRIQAVLGRMFAPRSEIAVGGLTDSTVLCRCENRTFGELKALLAANPGMTEREIKLNGRFAMGSCQGRFCADAVLAALSNANGGTGTACAQSLTGTRWPIRPVAISMLLAEPSSSLGRDER